MATKTDWKNAAVFVKRTGYQLFVKDYCARKKLGLSLPGTPSAFHQTHGLLMSNPGGLTNVRLQRDDVALTGQVTASFNYKKAEFAPTAAIPFKFVATLYYFEDGENKTETHTWNAPAGNVAWAAVSETFGTADRFYFHVRIIFYLDSYDADVYFANFLIQDHTIAWSAEYDGTVLPENADPVWAKAGGISTEKVIGKRLHLKEEKGVVDSVVYQRTPTFINAVGSTVKWRIKMASGPPKDSFISGEGWSSKNIDWSDPTYYWSGIEGATWADVNVQWSDPIFQWAGSARQAAAVVHADDVRRVEYLFYINGFMVVIGNQIFKYHLDMRRYRTFRSFIQGDRLYLYHGRTLLVRKELDSIGDQVVSFGHYGSNSYETETRWSYVKYYHGGDEDPGFDVLREGWWIPAGKFWEPDTLYRKTGWTFLPEYHVPYFNVVYLT